MNVGVLYICTGKYVRFWEEFHATCETNFLHGANKHYYVFTDQSFPESDLENVTHVEQANLGWPDNTLRRFHMFLKIEPLLAQQDYLFFFNANCRFLKPVGPEFLPQDPQSLLVVQHPGQIGKHPDRFPYERRSRSRAAISYGNGTHYVCGGVNGGTSDAFLQFSRHAKSAIDADFRDGIVAEWHDESHINRYILDHPYEIRHAGYCYPENWTIPADPTIEVRDKQHHGGRDSLRSLGAKSSDEELVTIALSGDLGSQMFQYAAARALSLRNQCRLQIDTRYFDTNGANAYGLGSFPIQVIIGTQRTLPPGKKQRLKYLAWRHLGKRHRLLRDDDLLSRDGLLSQKGNLYLDGDWRSDRFFADANDAIRKEFSFCDSPSQACSKLAAEISCNPSISVDLRHDGHFSQLPAHNLSADDLSAQLRPLLQSIAGHCPQQPNIFVFSDNCCWARQHVQFDLPVRFISDADLPPQETLRLMAACDHHVISSSPLSWWAAWLNPSVQKIIAGPAVWSTDAKNRRLNPLLFCWIKPGGSALSRNHNLAG